MPDILSETARFNLAEVKPHFINPCCFGEDLAAWLRERLIAKVYTADEPGQEDWGWYIEATAGDQRYFIGIGGNPDEAAADPNRGEWRVIIEKSRTLWEKITGRNFPRDDDSLAATIEQILRAEPGFENVHRE